MDDDECVLELPQSVPLFCAIVVNARQRRFLFDRLIDSAHDPAVFSCIPSTFPSILLASKILDYLVGYFLLSPDIISA